MSSEVEGPLTERLVHKSWKARSDAYEELTGMLRRAFEGDAVISEHADFIKGAVEDSNQAAQEKGLDLAIEFFNKTLTPKPYVEAIATAVVEKCFGARPATKAKGQELMLLMVEVSSAADIVSSTLVAKGFSHKLAKVVVPSVTCATEMLRAFGAGVVSPKPYLKSMHPLFEHADGAVRSAAIEFFAELHRWIGAAPLQATLAELRPAQQKDIEDAIAKLPPGKPQASKMTKAAAALAASRPAGEADAEAAVVAPEPVVNADDFVEEVAALSKISPDFFTQLESSKWSDRKDALLALNQAVNHPKLAPEDYSEVVRVLKKVIASDSNVNCVAAAVTCLGTLATGLKKNFAIHAKPAVGVLIEKTKDKNRSVVDAIHSSLDAFVLCVSSVADFVDEIAPVFDSSKVPKVRSEGCAFLDRAIRASKGGSLYPQTKALAELLIKHTDDSTPEVRDNAMRAVGALASILGESVVAPFLERLDKIKQDKVKEHIDASLLKPYSKVQPSEANPQKAAKPRKSTAPSAAGASDGSSSQSTAAAKEPSASKAAPKPASRPTSAVASSSASASGSASAAGSAALTGTVKRPASAAPAAKTAAPAKSSTKSSVAVAEKEEDVEEDVDDAEAVERAEAILPSEVKAGLQDKDWKMRLEALDKHLPAFIQSVDGAFLQENVLYIVRYLQKFPGPKESNFQVQKSLFSALALVASSTPTFPRRLCGAYFTLMLEKLADAKVRAAAAECLMMYVESTSTQLVFSQIIKRSSSFKNPKILAECISWMTDAITAFGLVTVNMKAVIDFLKSSLESTNPAVKSAAVQLTATLTKYCGPALRDFFTDVKPQLLAVVDDEIKKCEGEAPSQPTRVLRHPPAEAVGKSKASASSSALLDVLPRTDISGQLTSKLLKEMSDANWKIRLEALQQVEAIIVGANKLILPVGLDDTVRELKQRLLDSNKIVLAQCCTVIKLMIQSLGRDFDKFTKILVPNILVNFNDSKKNVREFVMETLELWCSEVSIDSVIRYIPKALAVESPISRVEVLDFLLRHLDACADASIAEQVLSQCIVCMMDRTGEVRQKAELVYKDVVTFVSVDVAKKALRELKPAQAKTIEAIVSKYDSLAATRVGGSSAASSSSASAVPAAAAPPAPLVAAASSSTATSTAVPVTATSAALKAADDARSLTKKSASAPSLPTLVPNSATAAPAPAPTQPTSSSRSSTPTQSIIASNVNGPLKPNDLKDSRAKKFKNLKWNPEDMRPDMIALVAEHGQQCFQDDLRSRMFSTDFKKHVEAFAELQKAIVDQPVETVQSLDCILKWCSLRLCDSNTTALLRCTEFLQALCKQLAARNYVLSDYEAGSLLPFLVEKCGASNTHVRDGLRSLFDDLCLLYSPQKVFAAMYGGLISRNSRTKSTLLEQMTAIFDRYKSDVVSATSLAKFVPAIGKGLSERDVNVREATLQMLTAMIKHHGESSVMKLLEGQPDSAMDILAERLRMVAKDTKEVPAPAKEEDPSAADSATAPKLTLEGLDAFERDFELELEKLTQSELTGGAKRSDEDAAEASETSRPSIMVPPTPMLLRTSALSLEAPTPKLPSAKMSFEEENESTDDIHKMTDISSKLKDTLAHIPAPLGAVHHMEEEDKEELLMNLNVASQRQVELLHELSLVLTHEAARNADPSVVCACIDAVCSVSREAFTRSERFGVALPLPLLLCKNAMNTMMQLFSRHVIASKVDQDHLRQAMQEVLLRLAQEHVPAEDDPMRIAFAINSVVLKMLNNADRTRSFVALLELLRDVHSVAAGSADCEERLRGLIAHCLLKVARQTSESYALGKLNITAVLNAAVQAWESLNLTEEQWSAVEGPLSPTVRSVSSSTDEQQQMPLAHGPVSALKIVVGEVALSVGDDLDGFFKKARIDPNVSTLAAYTRLVLSSCTSPSSRMAASAMAAQKSASDVEGGENLTPEIHAELTAIFDKISQQETVSEGLEMLFAFQNRHPSIDFSSFMVKCSAPFQAYIKKQLARMAIKRRRNRSSSFNSSSVQTMLDGMTPTSKRAARDASSAAKANGNGAAAAFGRTDATSDNSDHDSECSFTSTEDGDSPVSHFLERLRAIQERAGVAPAASPRASIDLSTRSASSSSSSASFSSASASAMRASLPTLPTLEESLSQPSSHAEENKENCIHGAADDNSSDVFRKRLAAATSRSTNATVPSSSSGSAASSTTTTTTFPTSSAPAAAPLAAAPSSAAASESSSSQQTDASIADLRKRLERLRQSSATSLKQ
jgi:cytoskeleton-associated protein 5